MHFKVQLLYFLLFFAVRSLIAQYVKATNHDIGFMNASVVTQKQTFEQRIFFEACYSLKDKYSAGTEYISISDIYKSLLLTAAVVFFSTI